MSDQSPGPGWWLASDGKWYPPAATPELSVPRRTAEPAAAGPRRLRLSPALVVFGGAVLFGLLMVVGLVAIALWTYRTKVETASPNRPVAGPTTTRTKPPSTTTPKASAVPSTTTTRPSVSPTTHATAQDDNSVSVDLSDPGLRAVLIDPCPDMMSCIEWVDATLNKYANLTADYIESARAGDSSAAGHLGAARKSVTKALPTDLDDIRRAPRPSDPCVAAAVDRVVDRSNDFLSTLRTNAVEDQETIDAWTAAEDAVGAAEAIARTGRCAVGKG